MSQFSNIFVFGKSGAGKQSFIDILSEKKGLGYTPLSTGDLFRSAINYVKAKVPENIGKKRGSNKLASDKAILNQLKIHAPNLDQQKALIGVKARYYVNAGLYAPLSLADSLFGNIFTKGQCKGFVVDGYPRCIGSTEYLLETMKKYNVNPSRNLLIYVHNEDKIIMERALGRRMCPKCKTVCHMKTKPPMDGKFCAKCLGNVPVVQRSDDTKEGVLTRLAEFKSKTLPAIELLARRGHLPICTVSGNVSPFTQENLRRELFTKMLNVVEF